MFRKIFWKETILMENNIILFFCGTALFFIKFVSFFSLTRKITQPSRYVIPSSTPIILKIQEYETWYLDVFFSGFSSCVNSVPFFTSFVPLLFWTGHCKLARQMTLLMAFSDYAGNFSKDQDVVLAPRPSVPAKLTTTKVDEENAMDYVLPPSRTFNTLCLSGYLLHYLIGLCGSDDLFTQVIGFGVVCSVLGLIGLGRIYSGMHRLVGICGLSFGIGILAVWLWVSEYNNFSVLGQNVISVWTALSFLLLFAYPTPKLSPSFEFQTALSGVALGIGIGAHQTFNQFHHENAARVLSPDLSVPAFVGRMLLGIPIILVVKFCCEALAKWIIPVLANTLGIPVRTTSYVTALLSPNEKPQHDTKQQPGYVQQKALLLYKQVFFDVDTGLRLFQYTGLAWSVVDLVSFLLSYVGL